MIRYLSFLGVEFLEEQKTKSLLTVGYNLRNAINGHSIAPERFILQPCFQKEPEINDPGPARLFN